MNAMQAYECITRRLEEDGRIFWNKITVLVVINFGLLSALSIKDWAGSNTRYFLSVSSIFFSGYWWIVLQRQMDWVLYWKGKLKKIESNNNFSHKVQTDGEEYERQTGILRVGSFETVTHVLPAFFIVIEFLYLFST